MEADINGMYQLSDAHFDSFKSKCDKWISFFGFNDWELDYMFSDEETDARAFTAIHCRLNRLASIVLNLEWDIDPTEESLGQCAFHEVLELLFSDLNILAADRQYDHGTFERERHRVIRIFERSLFMRIWDDEHGTLDIQSNAKRRGPAGQEIPGVHNNESVPGAWLRRLQSKSRRWINRLSPF
jgi:hypothetical protein